MTPTKNVFNMPNAAIGNQIIGDGANAKAIVSPRAAVPKAAETQLQRTEHPELSDGAASEIAMTTDEELEHDEDEK